MIGTTLDGKYRVEAQLGSGAMGAVYLAEHTATGRRVAVKVISTGDVKKDGKLVTRFQREARAAGSIETRHIAQVLDAGVDRDSGWPFLVMELLSGEDLQATIKRLGPLPPDVVLRIAAQCCLGLQKAHDKGVVHRDIKPANVFLAKADAGELTVKLLDFGIAKVKNDQPDPEAQGLTKTGAIVGSPLYMSPEQARGNAAGIDHRTDLWSLGALLYQALSGRTPFAHIEALGELILEICSKPPPPVQDFAPWVPPEVADVVHRCLRARRDDRFASADEMLAALRPLLPYGWGINEEMLVPVTPETLARPAPRLVMSVPPPPRGSVPPPPEVIANRDSLASPPGSATTGALAQSQPNAATQAPTSKTPMVIGGLAIAAIAASAAFFVTRGNNNTSNAGATQGTTTIVATDAPTAPPPPTTSAPTQNAVSVTPADTSQRRVKVVILPKDATIEVEGAKATAPGGLLEISGALGSVHRVKVTKGKLEQTTDVIVTENGASPPSIEVTATPKAPASSTAGAKVAPPTTPTSIPGVQEKFE